MLFWRHSESGIMTQETGPGKFPHMPKLKAPVSVSWGQLPDAFSFGKWRPKYLQTH